MNENYKRRFTPEQEKEIGRRIYSQEITEKEAMKEYELNKDGVTWLVRKYLQSINIDPVPQESKEVDDSKPNYEEMTKEELIKVIMKKDIEVARSKKGYTVKGGGKTKEFIILKNANSK